MKNPLNKRFIRELKSDFIKYAVIFVFMVGVIGSVSGFMAANYSLVTALHDNYSKYNMEDGNFELAQKAPEELLHDLEKRLEKEGLKLYPNNYIEAETEEISSVIRVFTGRDRVNQVCVMDGGLPSMKSEIAVDRMYAENNGLVIGDSLTLEGNAYTISGLIALPDYSALYQNPADMMFDASKFGVAYADGDGFARLGEDRIVYNYSWKYTEKPFTDSEAKKKGDDLLAILSKTVALKNFIPAYSNQAMCFVEDDIVKDNSLFQIFLYIVVAILAFIFAITTGNTISREASVIGTLRASGFSSGEMIRHYMTMPLLVLAVSALVGNLMGYTVLKDYMVQIYYKSYSLTTFKTIWNWQAFVKTTVFPITIMAMINYVMLKAKLCLSPLRFLRRDLKRDSRKAALYLNEKISFKTRFRIRTLQQNIPNYIMIFAGIFFAVFIMLFGMMFVPVIDRFEQDIKENMLCDYQYILKYPSETSDQNAEKYCVTSLMTQEHRYQDEEATIYGIQSDSRFCKAVFDSDKVFVSGAYAKKYEISIGDKVTLSEKYGDGEYEFEVCGIYPYPSTIAVFMSKEMFCTVFAKESGYFNGYLSNVRLQDLDAAAVAAVITEDDLTKTSRQMRISLGGFLLIFQVFGAVMFVLIIYLLSKIVIEKNSHSISVIKILGYDNREINSLYVWGTSVAVVVSTAFSLPLANLIMEKLFVQIFAAYPGWVSYELPAVIFLQIGVMTLVLYGLVLAVQMRMVRSIPMSDALKNVE